MIPKSLNYWFWIGTIYLIWLTIQDYRNNMMVDDRRNWFMMGLSISIYSHVPTGLLYKIVLSFLVIGFNLLFTRVIKTGIGDADINSLTWLMLGFGLIHYMILIYFYIIFTLLTITYYILKNIVFRYKKPVQFYGVIMLSFILTGLLIKGY